MGINELLQKENINIYPNPIKDELIIEIKGNKEEIDFEIENAIGQQVYKDQLIEKVIINTSDFNSGMYLVKFNNGKTVQFVKIVK